MTETILEIKNPQAVEQAQARGSRVLILALSQSGIDTVMILGASGAVGSSLIQLLHEKGIRVLTSAGPFR